MGLSGLALAVGCRGNQTAQVIKPGDKEMVGSHAAGEETFGPLVEGAVVNLLSQTSHAVQPAGYVQGPPPAQMRICFVGVENASSEEIGDFKEQIDELIDSKILHSQIYQCVSRRYVEAGLRTCRLRPDDLFTPGYMQMFTAAMQQMQQPFDFLLFAKLTSGTTQHNKDYQRNYLLTLEMVNVHNGQSYKESAELAKRYNVSAAAKLTHLGS